MPAKGGPFPFCIREGGFGDDSASVGLRSCIALSVVLASGEWP